MLLRQSGTNAPGIVRFLGAARGLRIAGPSGKAYVFRKGETTEVGWADWDWVKSLQEPGVRFEVLALPRFPRKEPLVEAEAPFIGGVGDIVTEVPPAPKRSNKVRDLPVEAESQD